MVILRRLATASHPIPRIDSVDKAITLLKKEVDEALSVAILVPHGAQHIAERAMRYSVTGAGHRWRGILLLALLKAIQSEYSPYLPIAAGLECLHAATLIIDDFPFVDNAVIRRGRECCHIRFSLDVANYASHLAFDLGETLLITNLPSAEADRNLMHLKELKRTLVSGQCLERALMNGSLRPTLVNLQKQYYLKSGAFFRYIGELAANLCGLSPVATALLRSFAQHTGVAYQIADDLIDILGKRSIAGKRIGMDKGKFNYPRQYGIASALHHLNSHRTKALSILEQLYRSKTMRSDQPLLRRLLDRIHQYDEYNRASVASVTVPR